MKVGDAVRVHTAGRRRLERGVVEAIGLYLVRVRTGLRSLQAIRADITVIRKPHERDTVIGRVKALRSAAANLTEDRGNKRVVSVPLVGRPLQGGGSQ